MLTLTNKTPLAMFLLTLFSLFMISSTSGAPVDLPLMTKRDVWDPTVLYPHTGTVWKVGNHHNVTWETSNAPAHITNSIGMVILAKNGTLDVANPLASNFSILLGRIEVQVPQTPDGDDYTIVLFGDSGNDSEKFKIEQ